MNIQTGQRSAFLQTGASRATSFLLVSILLLQHFLFVSPFISAAAKPAPTASAAAALVSPNLVISQVYGGGGATSGTPTYKNDYVELFNTGTTAVSLSGLALQYGSSTGNFGASASQIFALPNAAVQPGQYFLVQLGAVGTVGADLPVAPNASSTNLSMSAASGKVALTNVMTALGCGATAAPCTLPDSRIIDSVAYGASNNGEGNTTVNNGTTLSNTLGGVRKANGCQDTDNNNNDFTVVSAPVPRNASSPTNSCSNSTNPSGTGAANPSTVTAGNSTLLTVTVTPGANPASTNLAVRADLSAIGGAATQTFFNDGTNGDVTPGDNIFSYNAAVNAATAAGNKTLPVTITDAENRTGTTGISLTVNSAAPTNPSATGAANPSAVQVGNSTLLTVSVTPGTNPASSGIAVVADLSSIGGSAAQAFFDDGTNGDAAPGDNVFSYQATVANGTTAGAKTITANVSDAQARTASASISLTVTTSSPNGAQPLPFAQNWSNTNQITTNDVWSGVPGIVGYRGDDLTASIGTDPQTILTDGSTTPVNVWANQTDPNAFLSGGVAEFEIPNPTIALQGSGTADAPHIVISVDTTGKDNIVISYNLRDIDGSTDNSLQPVALQYRAGSTGNFTNVPAAFIADASAGPSDATKVTPVAVALPTAVNNQSLVQIRIITTNANGNDEWIGVDDISVVSGGTVPLLASGSAAPNQVYGGDSTLLTVTVAPGTNPNSTGISVTGNLTAIGGAASQQFYDDGTNGDATPGDNVFSFLAVIPSNDAGGNRSIPISVADAEGRNASTSISLSVRVLSAQVHLTMGNPSGATTDVNNPFNYLLQKNQYVMSYHRDRGTPNWVSWHLDSSWLGSASRQDDFRPDPSLPAGWYQVTQFDYSGSGFDRGHHTPSADRTATVEDNSATFFMTNMMPQAPGNNQGPWNNLEMFSRSLVGQGNELYIVMGGTGQGGSGSNGGTTVTLQNGKITVPAYTWKVMIILPSGGNDVSRVDANTRTLAVIMPNKDSIRNEAWQNYVATVDQVEALTGYDFFSNVPAAIQNQIESRLDSQATPQTIAGGTYANLDVTSPNTTLTGNITVTGNLNLAGSTLNANGFKITLAPNAALTRESGYVIGQIEKQFDNASQTTFVYPVGTSNGYSPVTATLTALGSSPSSLTVNAVQSAHPAAPDSNRALQRYWGLTENGDLTVNLVFQYTDADVPVGISESSLRLNRYSGSFVEIPSIVNAAANTISTSNISQFSDWTALAALNPTAGSVVLGGRILSPEGKPVRNASVYVTDQNGVTTRAVSNAFGYYRTAEYGVGQTVVITVVSKRYFFEPKVVNVTESTDNLNFSGAPNQ